MERTAHFVLRHRTWVYLFWLALLVAGVAGSGRLGVRVSHDFSLPDQKDY